MRLSPWISRIALTVLGACGASASFGQSAAIGPEPLFGTSSLIRYHVGYGEFEPENSTDTYVLTVTSTGVGRSTNLTSASFDAHPHLPSGAHLKSLTVYYCDTSATQHIAFNFLTCDLFGAQCNNLGSVSSSPPVSGPCGSSTVDLTPGNSTVENASGQLILTAFLPAAGAANVLLGADVGYTLQVSPAPAAATFSDVPTTSPQFRFVEALVAAGITAGCGGGNYCPAAPVTRGQMAVFLATALGLHFPD